MNRTIGIVSTNYSCPGLGSLVEKRPPASVPFGGRYRLMDFALSNMVNAGIRTVGLITPYYYRSILDHVGSGKAWDLDRKEGGLFILPGTVFGFKEEHTRFLFRDIIHNDTFLERGDGDYILFSSGDLVYNIDYRPMIEQHELEGKDVTLLYKVMPEGEAHKGYYLDINDANKVTALTASGEGSNLFLESFLINRSWLRKLVRDFKPLGHLDLMTVIAQNLSVLDVGAYAFDGYVGFTESYADYMKTSQDLLREDVYTALFHREQSIRTQAHDTPPALYAPGAKVRGSIITAGSIVEGTVEKSVVSRSGRIEAGAVVKNCVLMDNCVVRAGAQLENVICDKNVTILPDTCIRGTAERPVVIRRAETI